MTSGLWGDKFVGGCIYLHEPGPTQGVPWSPVPPTWKLLRFDAIDVLFISPFRVNADNSTFIIDTVGGFSFGERFAWVVQAARSANPNIKIILQQFMGTSTADHTTDFSVLTDPKSITTYADSVADFISSWYDKTLPSSSGSGIVSARLNGWDVDVELGNLSSQLPDVLTAVRSSLDSLSKKLGSQRFSVSITPYMTDYLTSEVATAIDYINMQNYDGGYSTSPQDYKDAMPGLQDSQLIWGISSEMPWLNTTYSFDDLIAKVQQVVSGEVSGIWAWRLNSGDYLFENMVQLWLYNKVKGTGSNDGTLEDILKRNWQYAGGLHSD